MSVLSKSNFDPEAVKAAEREREKEERARAKEKRILESLWDGKEGSGWSSDQILSRYFKVPRQRIWIWTREGKLPDPHKLGTNTTRWKNDEIKKAEVTNFLGGLYGE